MKTAALKNQLSGFYAEKRLSSASLSRLKAMSRGESPAPFWIRARPALGFAALAAMLFVVFLPGRPAGDLESIAQEIALNHNKDLGVEFSAERIPSLRRQMTKLDFMPIAPKRLEGRELKLIGARYCSIQGQLAAQIKFEDAAGNAYTLYQTPASDHLAAVPESTLEKSGARIEVWSESGLLMGLAGPPGEIP